MSDLEHGQGSIDDLPAYMDLLSHDILNMNQTVLSCIDLITAGEDLGERSRKHALRATSQMRISSQVFESIKTLCLLGRGGQVPVTPVDLEDETRKATKTLSAMLPDRKVTVNMNTGEGGATVEGGVMVYNALLNAFTNMAQLDPSEDLTIDADIRPAAGEKWEVRISDENASLPESFDPDALRSGPGEARSKVVRVAGLLLSKMMAERLGGSAAVERADDGGCALVITFKEVSG